MINSNMKGRVNHLKSVSKQDVLWLIEHNYLRQTNGKYDGLVTTGKNHVSRDKNHYIVNYLAEKLKFKNKKPITDKSK
jgi:hypothetical protein